MEHIALDNMVVCPSAAFFNGCGITWDETVPGSSVYFVLGICHHQLGKLIRQYSDNTEYLCDRLKAISDKRRLDTLKLIKAEPLCGQDLSERIGLSPGTIPHHMSPLVSAGFIHVDKQNPRGFNLEAARVLFWRKKSRKQVTGLSAGNSLSI